MRTNVDIDDELIREAMETSGLPTKKAAIEAALKEMIRRHSQRQALDELWGIGWDGDLDVMRDARGVSSMAQHPEFRTVTP